MPALVPAIADNTGTASYPFYKGTADLTGDPINFTLKVYDAIVKGYFRDEVEASASPTVSNVSIGKITGPAGPRGNNWLDSEVHRSAIIKLGPCSIHRKTFKGVKEYLPARS